MINYVVKLACVYIYVISIYIVERVHRDKFVSDPQNHRTGDDYYLDGT
jgi:hypothetical protein